MQRVASPLDDLFFSGGARFILIHQQLGPGESLATYGKEACWEVWTREQATAALRDLVGKQGLIPGACALHHGRIGGATTVVWQRRGYRRGLFNAKEHVRVTHL